MIMPHNLSRNERRMFRLHPEMFEDVQCIGYVGKPGCGYTGGISGDTCPKCGGRMMCASSRKEAEEMANRAIAAFEAWKEKHHE